MSNLSKKRRGTEPFSNTVFGPINTIAPIIADQLTRAIAPNILSNSFHYIVTEDDNIITTEDSIRLITE